MSGGSLDIMWYLQKNVIYSDVLTSFYDILLQQLVIDSVIHIASVSFPYFLSVPLQFSFYQFICVGNKQIDLHTSAVSWVKVMAILEASIVTEVFLPWICHEIYSRVDFLVVRFSVPDWRLYCIGLFFELFLFGPHCSLQPTVPTPANCGGGVLVIDHTEHGEVGGINLSEISVNLLYSAVT